MSRRYETRTVRLIGIRCHCSGVRQAASDNRDIRFTVRVLEVRKPAPQTLMNSR
jgi:hypothetical protein